MNGSINMNERKIPCQLLFISGLGADGRIFINQIDAFPDSMISEWPPVNRQDSLEDYAKAVADLSRPLLENRNRPLIVCGLSFGGMLAPFVAKSLNADGCILLASCQHPDQLRKWYRPLAWIFIRFPALFWLIALPCQFLLRIFLLLFGCALGKRWKSLLIQFNESGILRLYHFLRMILDIRWSPNESEEKVYPFPILHIHGEIDRVIPLKKVHPDIVLPRAGHLFLCWKPEETNQIIENFCNRNGCG